MNIYKVMIFLIIFSFLLNFFGSLGIYSVASSVAVNSTEYSAFTTRDPLTIITSIFGGASLLGLVAVGIGAVVGVNPLLAGAIGLISGTVLTTTFNTLAVFNKVSIAIGGTFGTIITGIVTIAGIVLFISVIWYINQMITGGQEFYE